jgi:CRISPR-associated protein Cas1
MLARLARSRILCLRPDTSSQGRLEDETRATLAKKVNERLEPEEPYGQPRLRLRSIIQSQARHLAVWVRGEGRAYDPWVTRW